MADLEGYWPGPPKAGRRHWVALMLQDQLKRDKGRRDITNAVESMLCLRGESVSDVAANRRERCG